MALFVGPVFTREAAVAPRRPRMYLMRAVYIGAILLLMCTSWLVMAGTQVIANIGDMARFGAILFGILAPLQLALMLFFSALGAASSVSQEKDRQTFLLLLMTRMSNSELVLGKLFASLLNILMLTFAAIPVFMLIVLLGGVSFAQVARVFAVTIMAALAAGSLGSLIALWREKTFQTLSITALLLVFWLGVWEAVGGGFFGGSWGPISTESIAAGFSPLRAIFAAIRPSGAGGLFSGGVGLFLIVSLVGAALLNGVGIGWVRIWNPTRELRPNQKDEAEEDSEQARAGHVDARLTPGERKPSRNVWDNPVLWREICTWAYGRKVLIIRAAYLVLFTLAALALHFTIHPADNAAASGGLLSIIPAAAQPLGPLFLVSLMVVNALAVTSITNERDGRSLDLLLVTDISPREFVFGKIGGVLWITKEMILLPLALTVYLWTQRALTGENLLFVSSGLVVMNLFVIMLGIHCGMTYSNSRTAIGVSLGTMFFLFLGIVTCMLIMISFRGSFQTQLAPFLAFILGGGVGLYVSLGARNPSSAIAWSSLLLPFATFYAITSFLLGNYFAVCLVSVAVYGFTTCAMLMPAIGEFNIAMGRSKSGDEE